MIIQAWQWRFMSLEVSNHLSCMRCMCIALYCVPTSLQTKICWPRARKVNLYSSVNRTLLKSSMVQTTCPRHNWNGLFCVLACCSVLFTPLAFSLLATVTDTCLPAAATRLKVKVDAFVCLLRLTNNAN